MEVGAPIIGSMPSLWSQYIKSGENSASLSNTAKKIRLVWLWFQYIKRYGTSDTLRHKVCGSFYLPGLILAIRLLPVSSLLVWMTSLSSLLCWVSSKFNPLLVVSSVSSWELALDPIWNVFWNELCLNFVNFQKLMQGSCFLLSNLLTAFIVPRIAGVRGWPWMYFCHPWHICYNFY